MAALAESLLRSFCAGAHDWRVYLHEPITRHGFTYATDGHVLVRVPADGREQTANFPPIDLDKPLRPHCKVFAPLVLPPRPELPPCDGCAGTGEVAACRHCEGEGVSECDMGHEHDCDRCEGRGTVAGAGLECQHCRGAKVRKVARTQADVDAVEVTIGTARFDWFLLERVMALPGIEFGIPDGDGEPCPFRFDGGIGSVMPFLSATGKSC